MPVWISSDNASSQRDDTRQEEAKRLKFQSYTRNMSSVTYAVCPLSQLLLFSYSANSRKCVIKLSVSVSVSVTEDKTETWAAVISSLKSQHSNRLSPKLPTTLPSLPTRTQPTLVRCLTHSTLSLQLKFSSFSLPFHQKPAQWISSLLL